MPLYPKVRLVVQALDGETPFELYVEPWGATYNVAPDASATVTFLGPDATSTPEVSVCRGSDHVIVCAEAAIEGYRVQDQAGGDLAPAE